MTRNKGQNRRQVEFTSLDESVPEEHLVRKLENAIDWSFVYELVEKEYSEDNGQFRPGSAHQAGSNTVYFNINVFVGDTAYKTPAIAKILKDEGISLLSTYSCPKTKDVFFRKYEYVYDEHYDCYICPADKLLRYSMTNKDGYREYKSDPNICVDCPYLNQCINSQKTCKGCYTPCMAGCFG